MVSESKERRVKVSQACFHELMRALQTDERWVCVDKGTGHFELVLFAPIETDIIRKLSFYYE